MGEDRNKDRFENWQPYDVRKLPFCDHSAMKLTYNIFCFTNLYINLFVPPSIIRKYYSTVFELVYLLQCITAHLWHAVTWIYGKTYSNTSAFSALILIPAWSHAYVNWSGECLRPFSEDESSTKSSAKINVDPVVPTVTPSLTWEIP